MDIESASGSEDATVKLWDTGNWTEIATLTGHFDWVSSVTFSPDNHQLVSGSYDRTFKIWDARDGQEITTRVGHRSWIWSVAFSQDGRLFASSGSRDHTIKIWDTSIWKEITSLIGHTDKIRSAVFSPDGRRLVSGGDDRAIKIWDTTNWTEIVSLARAHIFDKFSQFGGIFAGRSTVSLATRLVNTPSKSGIQAPGLKLLMFRNPTTGSGQSSFHQMVNCSLGVVMTVSSGSGIRPAGLK